MGTNYNRARRYAKSASTLDRERIDREISTARQRDNFRRIAIALFNGEDLNDVDTTTMLNAIRQLTPITPATNPILEDLPDEE